MGHIIPILEGGLTFLTLELFLFKPNFLIYILIALTLFVILGIFIPKQRFLNGKQFWHYLFTPLIFIWSAVLLFIFLESVILKHFFILGTALYLFLYFENLLYYLVTQNEEAKISFLRMINLMNVVSIFFLSAGFFAIKTFIQLSIWLLAVIFFIFSLGLLYNTLYVLKLKFKNIFWEILILSLLITEFFIIVHLLPIGFYVAGAIITINYYMLTGILLNKLRTGRASYRRYLITGFILLFVILFTARWV